MIIQNLFTESTNYLSEAYGTIENSKIAETIKFDGIDDNSKKIILPVTFVEENVGRGQYWKRLKNGNKKQLQALENLKSNPSFLKNGFNDTVLRQIYDENEYEESHYSFKKFKKKFHFIEIVINELGHPIVRYSTEKSLAGIFDDTLKFLKSK